MIKKLVRTFCFRDYYGILKLEQFCSYEDIEDSYREQTQHLM